MSGGTSASSVGMLSTAAQVAGTVTSTVGAYQKAKGEKQAYGYQSQVAKNNAQIAEWQAQDAITRGQVAQNNLQLKTAQIGASQAATMAARGLDISEGSPLNILTDTAFMGQRDVNTAELNSKKEAWSLRVQAANYTGDAELLKYRADSVSPFASAAGTLLTGAGKVASSWYSRNKGYAPSGSYDPSTTGEYP